MINRSTVWFDKIMTSFVTGNMKTNHRCYRLTGAKHLLDDPWLYNNFEQSSDFPIFH